MVCNFCIYCIYFDKLDTYKLYDLEVNEIKINDTGIAHRFDRDYMFKRHPNYTKLQWRDVEDGNT